MTCHLPTDRQKKYAESLVDRLIKDGHMKCRRFEEKVNKCICIQEMSELIDAMRGALEESHANQG